jgi:hypothetical protein
MRKGIEIRDDGEIRISIEDFADLIMSSIEEMDTKNLLAFVEIGTKAAEVLGSRSAFNINGNGGNDPAAPAPQQ